MIALKIIGLIVLYMVLSHRFYLYKERTCNHYTKSGRYRSYKPSIILYPYIIIISSIVMAWLFLDNIIRWEKYKFWKK